MSMILGNSTPVPVSSAEKVKASNGDVTRALNFGNVSKQVSFNDGNNEGYYKVRPKALKPSEHNPRPDWMIDDDWLVRHVGVDMNDIFESNSDSTCLVKLTEDEIDGKSVENAIYPEFESLLNTPNISQKKEYEFLVSLSKSIRETGQIQPIEMESNIETNTLVVLEGHLRRLACILGRIPYIKAIRNEGLHNLTRRAKIERQITENSLRSNISIFGNYKLACDEINENKKITVRELSARLKIERTLASTLIKAITNTEKYHCSIFDALEAGYLSSNNLIKVISITKKDRQELFISKLLQKNNIPSHTHTHTQMISPRGMDGRKKSVATMQIKSTENCVKAGNKLLRCIPDLGTHAMISEVSSVSDMMKLLKALESFLLENSNEER